MHRSYLFAPGHNARLLRRVFEAGADAVILDLEDAVPPDAKQQARVMVAGVLAERSAWVRINTAGTEVSSQVDAAHGQVPDTVDGRDLWGGEQPPGSLHRADYRHTGGAVSYPLGVVSGLGLRDPDPGGEPGDGVEVGGGQVGTDRIDPHPRGSINQNICDHRACPLLGIRRDGVLQVEYHRVRACLEHPAQQFGVVAWGEQVAAVHQIAPSARSSATRWGSRPSHSP